MSHDIINKNTIQSQTELGVLDIEEAKNSGNGWGYVYNLFVY